MGQRMEESGKRKDKKSVSLPRRLAVLAGAVFLFEILIGNYSSVRSLFYQETDLTDRLEVTWETDAPDEADPGNGAPDEADPGDGAPEGDGALKWDEAPEGDGTAEGKAAKRLTAVIDGLDMRIDNLHFDLEMPKDAVVSISISLVDEGNRYPYPLPVMEAAGRYPSTCYTNLYPYGKVHSLEIVMEAQEDGGLLLPESVWEGPESASAVRAEGFAFDGLRANVRRPFVLVLPRMLLLFGIGAFWLLSGEKSGVYRVRFRADSRRQNLATAGFLGAFLLLGLVLALSNRACVESPWEHHQQYRQLASAILDGHVWVGRQPELLELSNPYDTSYLLAQEIPYLADYAYYGGNYYVYFGIVPELLFYLPCLALTGRAFPNFLAVYFAFAGFAVSVFGLYREAVKRWFPDISYVLYLTAACVTLTFGSFVYLVARPDLYHVPLMTANMFTAAGLWLWLCGLNRKKRRTAFFFAGSLCMALVAGCRPQMLLFSAVALPLFIPLFAPFPVSLSALLPAPLSARRSSGSFLEKRSMKGDGGTACLVKEAAALLLPYAAVAAGILFYNGLRFSSPFDFGAAYSLTNNDMTHRGTNLSRILYGIYAFFLQPARYEGVFPFLTANGLENNYMGKMVSEFLFGGILASQSVCWCLALLPACRKKIAGAADKTSGAGENNRTGKELLGLLACALAASVIIVGFDANAAGILQRYTADAAFGVALSSCFVLLALFDGMQRERNTERIQEQKEQGAARRYGLIFLRAALLQHALYAFLIVFACGDSVNLKNYGRLLYYGAKRLFQI